MDDKEELLLAVFDYYGLPTPGSGERSQRCPVHDDTVASASINRSKGLIYCHACGFGGSAVDLVMVKEGLGYREAVDFIGHQIGVTTGAVPTRTTRRSPSRRKGGRWVPPRLRDAV